MALSLRLRFFNLFYKIDGLNKTTGHGLTDKCFFIKSSFEGY
jgi:hypothetical protein